MNNNNTTVVKKNGIGFFGALTIAFIVLKLMKIIAWSWLWVLAPLWMPVAIYIAVVLVIALVCGLCGIVINAIDKVDTKNKRR